MTGLEAAECAAIIENAATALLSALPSKKGSAGAALRRAVGFMIANAESLLRSNTFAATMQACLDAARTNGTALVPFDRVRKAALAEVPQSLPATLTVQVIVRLALAQEARIIAAMQFTSRDDATAVADAATASFSAAAEVAADELDAGSYMAIVSLQAAVAKHLADAGRVLPRVIDYAFPAVMPSLTMAQRVYSDGGRSDELRDENKVVHPAFMPMTGRMLAV
jgi:prophage DNA circulation protein